MCRSTVEIENPAVEGRGVVLRYSDPSVSGVRWLYMDPRDLKWYDVNTTMSHHMYQSWLGFVLELKNTSAYGNGTQFVAEVESGCSTKPVKLNLKCKYICIFLR